MVREFSIKERKDGREWRPLGKTIVAGNWQEATKCFTEWIMEWLDEENSDHATHELEEISKAYRAKEYFHTYRKDTTTWTIKRID